MKFRNLLIRLFAGTLLACVCNPLIAQSAPRAPHSAPAAASGEASSGYNQPQQNILEVMRAPSPPQPIVSPTHDNILLVSWQAHPSISRLATPLLRLAGARAEPGNHSNHDTPAGYGITPCAPS